MSGGCTLLTCGQGHTRVCTGVGDGRCCTRRWAVLYVLGVGSDGARLSRVGRPERRAQAAGAAALLSRRTHSRRRRATGRRAGTRLQQRDRREYVVYMRACICNSLTLCMRPGRWRGVTVRCRASGRREKILTLVCLYTTSAWRAGSRAASPESGPLSPPTMPPAYS